MTTWEILFGDKDKSLGKGVKGMHTDESGPKPCPPDLTGGQWLTNRQKYLLATQYVTVSVRKRLTNRQEYIFWMHDT